MTSKHTPAPWVIGEFDENGGYDCMTAGLTVGPVTLDGADYGQNAGGDITDAQRAHMEADAALIGAAPEVLGALKNLLAEVECGTALECPLCDAARAAIAKAEGR